MKYKKTVILLLCLVLVFVFYGCGEDTTAETKREEVVIATKNTQEQLILAHLASILITEKTQHEVRIETTEDMTSEALHKALKDKKIDLYFDYAGSVYTNALGYSKESIPYATILVELQKIMIEEGIFVSESLGYDGGTILYITPETREKWGDIASISELKSLAKDVTIGMEPGFYQQNDCYKALCKTYGLKFKDAKTYSEDEGFYALRRGDIDIMVGSRTSVYNNMFNLYLLTDDKRFFMPETVCYLADDQLLLDYPELTTALETLEDMLTSGKISVIKRRVFLGGNDIDTYLYDFLRARNLL